MWGEGVGLVRPMRLIGKSLRGVEEKCLNTHLVFECRLRLGIGHFGGLDEPGTAACN